MTPAPFLLNDSQRRRAMALALLQGMLGTASGWLLGAQFVNFFAMELGASGMMMGLILAVPNITGLLRIVAPYFINRSDNRRAVCIVASCSARLIAIALPLLAFPRFRLPGIDPLWLLIAVLCCTSTANFLSDIAWLSWFADIVPERIWGRYFGLRNICNAVVAMTIPYAGSRFVDGYIAAHPDTKLVGYAMIYGCGITFGLLALAPLLFVPNIPLRERRADKPILGELARPFRDANFRRMAYFGCVLMLGSGIPQASFYLYLKNVLLLPLATFTLLQNVVNRVFDIIGNGVFGNLSDRYGNKAFIALGLIGAASGPFFWLPTSPGNYGWLFAAYVIWGLGWAPVHLCSQNLMLKLAPRENNSAYIAAYQGTIGICLAVCQIIGGKALDYAVAQQWELPFLFMRLNAYQIFFLLSFFGRSSAVFFVMRIHEEGALSVKELWSKEKRRGASLPESYPVADQL